MRCFPASSTVLKSRSRRVKETRLLLAGFEVYPAKALQGTERSARYCSAREIQLDNFFSGSCANIGNFDGDFNAAIRWRVRIVNSESAIGEKLYS